MSGHNKWSQIQRQKGINDGKKSQIFGKISKEISLAARKGADPNMTDPSVNTELRKAIEKGKAVNMPKDNVERAIQKGSGSASGGLEAVRYEAYGPGGIAIVIDAITDNKNRTVAEIKHLLSRNGGTFAGTGAAIWAFETSETEGLSPKITIPLGADDEASLHRLLDTLDNQDDVQSFYTNAE